MRKLLAIAIAMIFAACSSDDSETINQYPKGIVLKSQAEVDAFAALGLTELNEKLSIGFIGLGATDITSLAGLKHLKKANRIDIVENPNLKDLAGLENLQKVDTLIINNNISLKDLKGLRQLSDIMSLGLYSNYALTNLQGLEGITSIDQLDISYNNNLNTLQGINNLVTINILNITLNDKLLSLEGIDSLTYIKNIFIQGGVLSSLQLLANVNIAETIEIMNSQLVNLSGLENITTLKYLRLSSNDYLESFNGLDNLDTVNTLHVTQNKKLTSISSLASLKKIEGTGEYYFDLHIINNNALQSLDGLQNATAGFSRIVVSNNTVLNDFCALKNMVANSNSINLTISENPFNPTIEDIKSGNCSLN